jgi:hypothetical protein
MKCRHCGVAIDAAGKRNWYYSIDEECYFCLDEHGRATKQEHEREAAP